MDRLVKKSVKELKNYVVEKEPINIILNANENPNNLFTQLKVEFFNRIGKISINRYPDTDSIDLTNAIGKAIGVQDENIICGNGSDEIIQIIINAFVDTDDSIIVPTPTFSMYGIFSTIIGGKVIEVPTKEDFSIDVKEIIKQSNNKSAKLIFLCNPNNPTGNLIPRESILKIINETSSIIVLDEAYGEFCNETNIDQIKNPRVIILRTFSKAFALAGARLGYGVAHRETIDILMRVKAPYNLNVFSQVIGEIILENQDIVQKSVEEIIRERDRVEKVLRNVEGIKVYPSKANFVLIRSEKTKEIIQQCKKQGIGVRAFNEQSPLEKYIRLSIGSFNENNRLIDVIKELGE